MRLAVRERQRVALNYTDVNGNNTEREVRPLGLAFFAPHWTLASWCELREDFRTFRLDRMLKVLPTGTNVPRRARQANGRLRQALDELLILSILARSPSFEQAT